MLPHLTQVTSPYLYVPATGFTPGARSRLAPGDRSVCISPTLHADIRFPGAIVLKENRTTQMGNAGRPDRHDLSLRHEMLLKGRNELSHFVRAAPIGLELQH